MTMIHDDEENIWDGENTKIDQKQCYGIIEF